MRVLIITATLLLSGCVNMDRVTFHMKCQEMYGRVGNNCTLDVPASSLVEIDGNNINVKYVPKEEF